MKLYGYKNENGKIAQTEIEAEEKVVLVPKENGSFPFIYDKQIDMANVGEVIGYYPTIFLKEPNFNYAKEKFLKKARESLAGKEKYRDKVLKDVEDFKKELEILEKASENSGAESDKSNADL